MSLATSLESPVSRVSRKPRSTQATSRRASQVDAKPRKVSFYLSADAIRRLGVAASMMDTDKSKVLEEVLANSQILKRYVVSDRSRNEADRDVADMGNIGSL